MHVQLSDISPEADFYITVGQGGCDCEKVRVGKSDMTPDQDGGYSGEIPSRITKDMKPGRYYAEIFVKDPSGRDYVGQGESIDPCFTITCSMSKDLVE